MYKLTLDDCLKLMSEMKEFLSSKGFDEQFITELCYSIMSRFQSELWRRNMPKESCAPSPFLKEIRRG